MVVLEFSRLSSEHHGKSFRRSIYVTYPIWLQFGPMRYIPNRPDTPISPIQHYTQLLFFSQ